jgi:alpha-glucosidase
VPGASNPIRRGLLKSVLAVREVAALGPGTFAAIAANSVRTEQRRRRDDRAEWRAATTRGPGRLLDVVPVDRAAAGLADGGSLGRPADGPVPSGGGAVAPTVGARCRFTEAELEVVFLAPDLIRLGWGPDTPPLPWGLAPAPPSGWGTTVSVEHPGGGAGCAVVSTAVRLEVATDGEVRVLRPDGTLVRREFPPLRRGAARIARIELRDGERVSGLGEQASPVDLRGTTHRLWNRDPGGAWGPGDDPLYCPMPVLVGLHPDADVLSFYENSYDAVVSIGPPPRRPGPPPRVELAFSGGMLRHYLAVGTLASVLGRHAELTGRPPLPARWSLGFHQCRWGYRSAADVREVADGFAGDGLPLSAVHLDIDYMDGYRVFTVSAERFADLPGLVGELAGHGTRVVTIVDPAVKADPGYDVYDDGCASGRFLLDDDGRPLEGVVWPGRAVFPDFTDPATRGWWADRYAGLLDAGVAGIWHDMNEPTSITLWGDRTVPKSTRHAAEGRGGDHRECHNVYGLLMDRAGYEALVAAHPDRRPFLLSRAGWVGLQRWAWNWTADIESSWDGLRQQVATAIGLGLSGVPYTGSDIGGFSGVPGPELFLRWLELSVLMPFCRTHSVLGSPPREPWRFDEPYRSAIGRLIRFRYRLLPYLYTCAWQASQHGSPLVRPLSWTGAGSSPDRRLWAVDDQFLLGDALLVAPVTASEPSRVVVLPSGRWFRWRPVPPLKGSGAGWPEVAVVDGGRSVTVAAPPGMAPLFVRAGSVVVTDDGWSEPRDGGRHDGRLDDGHRPLATAVHCFPTTEGRAAGVGYDDDGDGYGPSRVDRFELSPQGAAVLELRWRREGAYPPPAVRVVVHGLAATDAEADGRPLEVHVERHGAVASTTVECPPFDTLWLHGSPAFR